MNLDQNLKEKEALGYLICEGNNIPSILKVKILCTTPKIKQEVVGRSSACNIMFGVHLSHHLNIGVNDEYDSEDNPIQ